MVVTSILLAGLIAVPPHALVLHDCTFGEVHAFARAECVARIDNPGGAPVRVKVELAGTATGSVAHEVSVPARGSVYVPLKVDVGDRSGELARFFTVSEAAEVDDALPRYLKASGFALSALDELDPRIEFGVVEAGSAPSRQLGLSSRETANFRITKVLDKPPQLDVKIADDGRSIVAAIRKDAAWGVLSGVIELGIDTPRQREAWVAVEGLIRGGVQPSQNPAQFGLLEGGREHTVSVTTLDAVNEGMFESARLDVEGIDATAKLVPCVPSAKGCRAVELTISAAQAMGPTTGTITVHFPTVEQSLRIAVRGAMRRPERESAKEIADIFAKRRLAEQGEGNRHNAAKPVEEPDRAEHSQESAQPPGEGPLLKWRVLDERSVHGYQIYRADLESGPFVLLSTPTIPARSKEQAGSAYQWRDTSAVKGETYWYYVGVVYDNGGKEKITPEIKALAK